MFYRTQIKATGAGYAIDVSGKRLIFAANYPCKAGDYVWTDGKIIFGNVANKPQPVIFDDDDETIPVLTSQDLRGYFTQSGKFKKYAIAYDTPHPFTNEIPFIVNDEENYKHGLGVYLYDAEVSEDGKLLTANLRGKIFEPNSNEPYIGSNETIIIKKDGVEVETVDPREYVEIKKDVLLSDYKPADSDTLLMDIINIDIEIREFKLNPDLTWTMIFNADIQGYTLFKNAVKLPLGSEYVEKIVNNNEDRIDVPLGDDGRQKILADIQGRWQAQGVNLSVGNIESSPFQNLIATAYGYLVALRYIKIYSSHSEIGDIGDPRFVAKRYFEKHLLIKVENKKPEILIRRIYLPEFKTDIATEETENSPIHLAEGEDAIPDNAARGDAIKVGDSARIEYWAMIGTAADPEYTENLTTYYPYCFTEEISLENGEIGEDDDEEDWEDISKDECFFPVQDDFSVKYKIENLTYAQTLDEWIYGDEGKVIPYEDIYSEVYVEHWWVDKLYIHSLYYGDKYYDLSESEDILNSYSPNVYNNNLCAVKLRGNNYLFGFCLGNLFKLKNGNIEFIDKHLYNYRLRKLKKISTARK